MIDDALFLHQPMSYDGEKGSDHPRDVGLAHAAIPCALCACRLPGGALPSRLPRLRRPCLHDTGPTAQGRKSEPDRNRSACRVRVPLLPAGGAVDRGGEYPGWVVCIGARRRVRGRSSWRVAGAERFMLISTEKAVNPSSVMTSPRRTVRATLRPSGPTPQAGRGRPGGQQPAMPKGEKGRQHDSNRV